MFCLVINRVVIAENIGIRQTLNYVLFQRLWLTLFNWKYFRRYSFNCEVLLPILYGSADVIFQWAVLIYFVHSRLFKVYYFYLRFSRTVFVILFSTVKFLLSNFHPISLCAPQPCKRDCKAYRPVFCRLHLLNIF